MSEEKVKRWKRIPGFKRCHASRSGQIAQNRKLVAQTLTAGYYRVKIGGKHISVHRLVAMAWHDNPNNLPVVNHKNRVKTDNSVDNLEWCTYKENSRHAIANGVEIRHFTPILMYEAVLVKVPERRLTKPSKKSGKGHMRTFQITKATKGKLIKEFNSVNEALDYVNELLKAQGKNTVKRHTISKVLVGENNIGGGYIWEYKKDRRVEIPETARTVPGYPMYKCDINGDVYRVDKKWLIKTMISEDGRRFIHISKTRASNTAVRKDIHKLVAQLFLPNPNNKTRVKHIDGDLANNNVKNLRWV